MNNLINFIIKKRLSVYFVSPHFDDAIFSAGGLIHHLSDKVEVNLINVFTKAQEPTTVSGKEFLSQCKYSSPKQLFRDRQNEDRDVTQKIKIKVVNLGLIDALWRKMKTTNMIRQFLGKFLPELIHVYPTYKLHVIRGVVSKNDFEIIKVLSNKLSYIIGDRRKVLVFCPLAIGNHVDHIIVRDVCRSLFENVIYWVDFPYSESSFADQKFIKANKLKPREISPNTKEKIKLMMGYKSQLQAIFPKGVDHLPSEVYYLESNLL